MSTESSSRNYPVPRVEEDPRFTLGLAIDAAGLLVAAGYPQPTGADLVELQQALFRFIYSDRGVS